MKDTRLGIIAAGHTQTAQAGAEILRAGGNAVDAAIAAMAASCVTEPVFTGLGGGGYMLVAGGGIEPKVLDFFVEAPGRNLDPARRAPLKPITVSFGDAVQVFNIGAASCGVYGVPSGICEAAQRYGSIPLPDLLAPAIELARRGVQVTSEQAYHYELLEPIVSATPEARELFMPEGRMPVEGDVMYDHTLANTLERLGVEGVDTFYTGDIANEVFKWLQRTGAGITREDMAAYRTIVRDPIQISYRGRDVLTVPPPNAGGTLIAYSLAQLQKAPNPPETLDIVRALESAQAQRTPEFLTALIEPGFFEAFIAKGSTTHISVMDSKGRACSVTTTHGVGSGDVIPGTGIHMNNIMGEPDLSPFGFFTHPPGRRLPSMMAPTIVTKDGEPQLVVGSAGAHRIRSAILQTIVNAFDHGMDAEAAVSAPRLHYEDGIVYVEPGIDAVALEAIGLAVARFRASNMFFGGVQAVEYNPETQTVSGAGDPRRGGAAIVA